MKKTIFYLALAAVAAVSCVKEQNPGAQAPEKTLAPMEFLACAEKTKTALADDGMSVEWIEGDQVAIFDGSNMNGGADEGQRFKAQSSGAAVLLAGEADPAADEYYAIYPFGSGHSLKDGVFTSTIKAQQTVTAGSMAENCAVVVGKAVAGSTKMEFKNVCTLVKFPLEVEGVKSLTLIGNNNEVIAGKFTCEWNDGDPQITAVTAPQVAVTLRKSDGSSLELGDYYFTIIPTNFEDGFSVVLGMNDEEGTQKIVTRSSALDLKKNQIFRTQNVPESAYKAYSSNYLRYNDGFDFTFNNVTINKTIAGDATYVYKDGTLISKDGVYFVSPDAKNIELGKLGTKKFFVMGDDSSVRSSVNQTRGIQPQNNDEGKGFIVLSGLNISDGYNLSQYFLQQTEDKNGFTDFGDIVVDNCKFDNVRRYVMDASNRDMTLDNFIIQNSDFIVKVTTSDKAYSYMFNSGKSCTINNVVFHNNVFHNGLTAETGDVLTNFRLANATSTSIGNLTVTNNTVSNLKVSDTYGCVYTSSLTGEVNATSNFFVNFQTKDKTYLIYSASASETMSYNVKDNFYHANDWNLRLWAIGIPTASNQGTKVSSVNPSPFVQYPLSADWNPGSGVFGYVDGLKYGKLVTTTTPNTVTETGGGSIPSYRGAQR